MDARRQALDAVLDDVAAHYDVGHWWDVQPVSSGIRIATESGEFVAAVSPPSRTDASLRFEAMLLTHLADKTFRAPRLVRTRAGRPWRRTVAGTAVVVTEWVGGGAVDASLAQPRRRGVRVLAEYHAAVRSFPVRLRAEGGPTLSTLERKGPAALEAFTGISGRSLDADGRRRLRSASSYLWRQFVRIRESLHAGGATLPRLVIHGGFGRGAVVLDGGGPGIPADGLVGFEHARYDVRAVDLAAALECFGRAGGGIDLDRCADLVAAYDEVDRLSLAEVKTLPVMLRIQRLARVFRVASGLDDGAPESVVRESAEVVNDDAARLRWLEENERALIDALGSALVG